MARKRFHVRKPKKCPTTRKTMFRTEKDASYAMMRTWAHDSHMDIYSYHTYECPDCKSWHFGNKETYEKFVKPTVISDSVSIKAA